MYSENISYQVYSSSTTSVYHLHYQLLLITTNQKKMKLVEIVMLFTCHAEGVKTGGKDFDFLQQPSASNDKEKKSIELALLQQNLNEEKTSLAEIVHDIQHLESVLKTASGNFTLLENKFLIDEIEVILRQASLAVETNSEQLGIVLDASITKAQIEEAYYSLFKSALSDLIALLRWDENQSFFTELGKSERFLVVKGMIF